MFKTKLTLICVAVIVLASSVQADFPAEINWSKQLESNAALLGPYWQNDDGQTSFLLGSDRILIISENDITWESNWLRAELTALNYVDFGVNDGNEILAATVSDSGKIHIFTGERFNEHRTYSLYFSWEGGYQPYEYIQHDDRHINSIDIFTDLLPDSSRTVYIGNIMGYYEEDNYGNQHSWSSGTAGGFRSISLCNIIPMIGPEGFGAIIDTDIMDANNDGELEMICGSYRRGSSFGDRGDSGFSDANITIFNNELNTIISRRLVRYSYRNRGDSDKHVYLYAMEAFTISDSMSYLAVSYKDTTENFLALLSLPELETVELLRLRDRPFVDIHVYNKQDDETDVFLICFDNTGKLYTVCLDGFQRVDYRNNFAAGFVSSEVGNFDDDEDLEMAVLTERWFTMYDLGRLSAPSGSSPPWVPERYAITAAYPNPFNSSTRIIYSIADPGNITMLVYDLTGREIVKLVNGWRNIGEYDIVLNGDNLTSGVYLISLDANGQRFSKRVQLVR